MVDNNYIPRTSCLKEDFNAFSRFATVKYDHTGKNLWNPCMHLCNYSINKYHSGSNTRQIQFTMTMLIMMSGVWEQLSNLFPSQITSRAAILTSMIRFMMILMLFEMNLRENENKMMLTPGKSDSPLSAFLSI